MDTITKENRRSCIANCAVKIAKECADMRDFIDKHGKEDKTNLSDWYATKIIGVAIAVTKGIYKIWKDEPSAMLKYGALFWLCDLIATIAMGQDFYHILAPMAMLMYATETMVNGERRRLTMNLFDEADKLIKFQTQRIKQVTDILRVAVDGSTMEMMMEKYKEMARTLVMAGIMSPKKYEDALALQDKYITEMDTLLESIMTDEERESDSQAASNDAK